ncbi:MAG TPA: diguanylate cyclase [Burkholderiales bacterium]|nr:diguanylate cyclase [Burkholderiales bacterium]
MTDRPSASRPHPGAELFRAQFERSPVPRLLGRVSTSEVVAVNAAMLRLLGLPAGEVLARPVADCGLWTDGGHADRVLASVLRGEAERFESRIARSSGGDCDVEVTAYLVHDGGERYLAAEAFDVSGQKEAAHKLRLAGTAFAHMSEGLVVVDVDACFVSVNPAFTRMTGYTPEEALGRTPRELLHEPSGHHGANFFRAVADAVNRTGSWAGEMWSRKKSGEVFPQMVSIASVRDGDGRVVNHVAVQNDITALKAKEAQLEHIAHHDPLTSLPNRKLLIDRCNVALVRAARAHRSCAVLCVDLDRFKPVNDRHGHGVGDELLCMVALRLQGCVRASDTVARIGGDEFVVLLDDITRREDAVHIAAKVNAVLSAPFDVMGHELRIAASVGIAISPEHGADTATLMRHGDKALYAAKDAGRNRYAVYGEAAAAPPDFP